MVRTMGEYEREAREAALEQEAERKRRKNQRKPGEPTPEPKGPEDEDTLHDVLLSGKLPSEIETGELEIDLDEPKEEEPGEDPDDLKCERVQ